MFGAMEVTMIGPLEITQPLVPSEKMAEIICLLFFFFDAIMLLQEQLQEMVQHRRSS